jgi:hypothetical protein
MLGERAPQSTLRHRIFAPTRGRVEMLEQLAPESAAELHSVERFGDCLRSAGRLRRSDQGAYRLEAFDQVGAKCVDTRVAASLGHVARRMLT